MSAATLFFALLSLVLAVLLWRSRSGPVVEPPVTPPARSPSARRTRPPRLTPAPRATANPVPSPPAEPRRTPGPASAPAAAGEPSVAILIDDLGNDAGAVDRICRWPWAVSAAVLPRLPASSGAARDLERSGKQVLLHLPMEPRGYPDVRPGPGVVLRSQSDEEIASTLRADLDTVPGAVGVNNHMGSAATADLRVMRAVARVLSARGLFFVDSRTTEATVARDAALDEKVRSASRKVFLDDDKSEAAIEASLSALIAHARVEGSAIGIGHPYPSTLAVLDRELPKLASRGVTLVRVGELVR